MTDDDDDVVVVGYTARVEIITCHVLSAES